MNARLDLYVESDGYVTEGPISITTASTNITADVEMEFAPITIDGTLQVDGVPGDC